MEMQTKHILAGGIHVEIVTTPIVYARPRSPGWDPFRDRIISGHPYCAACGRTKKLELHHIHDFAHFPELELSEENVIVLCRSSGEGCHAALGHFYEWDKINPDVLADALRYFHARQTAFANQAV